MLKEEWWTITILIPDMENVQMVAIRSTDHMLVEIKSKVRNELCEGLVGIRANINLVTKTLQIDAAVRIS